MWAFVDPGLANTAVIVGDKHGIVAAKTFTTPGEGQRVDFGMAVARAKLQADRVRHWLDEWEDGNGDIIQGVVCEAFGDIPGKLRNVPNRWSTPMVCMAIADRLPVISWQDPEVVMTAGRRYKLEWKAKRFGLVPGDNLLTNDHLRSCGCHLVWWAGGGAR